jgi:DNA-binding SARP family transcriptional activator
MLGHYAVQVGGRSVELPGRPVQLLLAYLAIHTGKVQPRENLAALFWPDSTPENARGNLRHALWQLRKALGEGEHCLEADDFSITFLASDECVVDVVVLEQDPATLHSEEALMAAAAVYDGDLLPGFYEPWVVLERERLEAVFEHKMELLLGRLLDAGRYTAAIGAAERWIALGTAPEPAYRVLMTAHAKLGHTSHVLTAYARCRDTLRESLGLAPSTETDRLLRSLLPTGALAASAAADTPAPASAKTTPDETAELRRQLQATRLLAEQERQVAEAHRRATVRATRVTAGLAMALAGVVGAWLHDRSRRRPRE